MQMRTRRPGRRGTTLGRRIVSAASGLLLCILYVAVFSTLSILKHRNIHSHAFDLGLFQQVVWNTAHGEWFDYTYKVGLEPGLTNYLGDHFDLILLPIALLYPVWDRPEILLVLQTSSLAAAGFLIFSIARRWSGSALTASLFQLLFYLHPAVQGPNLFDFHPLVLAPAFLLVAFLGVEEGRFGWVLAGAILALLCREQVAIYVAALGIYGFVRKRRVRMLLVSALSLAWLGLTVRVLIPIFHPAGVSQHFIAKFGYLGSTPLAALRNLVMSPHTLLGVLGDPDRIRYVADLFRWSGIFLPLLSPGVLLIAFSEMAVNLFSQEAAQRIVVYQYSATAAAFLVLAAARGAAWIGKWIGTRSSDRRWARSLLATAVGMTAVAISLFFHHSRFGTVYPLGRDLRDTYRSSDRARLAYRFMSRIPDTESLSVQSDLAPHLSNRPILYVFPVVEEARYVLLDLRGETFPAQLFGIPYAEQVRKLRDDVRYEVVLEEGGYVLFRRKKEAAAGSQGSAPVMRRAPAVRP